MANFGITGVSPNTLLKMLEKQLQESGTPSGSNQPAAGLADRAFLSLWQDELHLTHPKANQFVTIRPTSWPVWQAVVAGAGRENTGFDASFIITCFIQMSTDPELKSVNALSEEVLGVSTLISVVASAIQFWEPTDGDGNDLLREPARIADPGFRFTPVNGRDGPWVKAAIDYGFRFTALLPTLA